MRKFSRSNIIINVTSSYANWVKSSWITRLLTTLKFVFFVYPLPIPMMGQISDFNGFRLKLGKNFFSLNS